MPDVACQDQGREDDPDRAFEQIEEMVRDLEPVWVAGAVSPPRFEKQHSEELLRGHGVALAPTCKVTV